MNKNESFMREAREADGSLSFPEDAHRPNCRCQEMHASALRDANELNFASKSSWAARMRACTCGNCRPENCSMA